jgi:hypothetical protein
MLLEKQYIIAIIAIIAIILAENNQNKTKIGNKSQKKMYLK